jgi:hypothetical protein
MYGGLVGTLQELEFIDHKLYPRRKRDPLKNLRKHFTDTQILEWLVNDILRERKKRPKKNKIIDEIPMEEEAVYLEPEYEPEYEPAPEPLPVKKKGRPKKYATEAERKKAKLVQTLASNKKKRAEKKLNKK